MGLIHPAALNIHGATVTSKGFEPRGRTRPIHLHLVRHTLAVELLRAGVTIVDAAALLGHTPDVFVSTYLRKSEAGVRSAASALGAALAGGS